MNNKQEKKYVERHATSRKTIEAVKRVDGRDIALSEVRKDSESRFKRDGSEPFGGPLQLPLAPLLNSHATRKDYVDGRVATRIADATGAVLKRHIAANNVGYDEIGPDQVSIKHYVAGSIGAAPISNTLRGGANGGYTMRRIGLGNGPDAAGEAHNHNSVNFKVDYTDAQKEATISLRSQVEELVEGGEMGPFEPMARLLLDLAHQLIDEPTMRAEEWLEKRNTDPEFRHNELMRIDPLYSAAWHDEFGVELDERTKEMARRGREKYGEMIVRDPEIVEAYKKKKRIS